MNLLRRATHWPMAAKVARTLHVSGPLRKAYYYCVSPRTGVLRVKVCGIEAAFYARTPEELRGVERDLLAEHDFLRVLLSTLRSGEVFWDIGSSIGQFAIPVAKIVGAQGQVVAFEPESESCRKLQSHIALNGLSNVRVFQRALGAQVGKATLFVKGRSSPTLIAAREGAARRQLCVGEAIPQDSKRYSESPLVPSSGVETVEVVRGDWFRATEGLPAPRAVKIDVEGYEEFVLRGLEGTLSEAACELLCCEIHPSEFGAEPGTDAIIDLVRSMGFTRIELAPRWTQIHITAYKAQTGSAGS